MYWMACRLNCIQNKTVKIVLIIQFINCLLRMFNVEPSLEINKRSNRIEVKYEMFYISTITLLVLQHYGEVNVSHVVKCNFFPM